jgi:uncharacterized cysteine cluster protein YcgN (CxxCxxCC family)
MNTRKQGESIYQKRIKGGHMPHQIWWDVLTKSKFNELCKDYDPRLDMAPAIMSLIEYAIEKHWLPRYAKKERTITTGEQANDKRQISPDPRQSRVY